MALRSNGFTARERVVDPVSTSGDVGDKSRGNLVQRYLYLRVALTWLIVRAVVEQRALAQCGTRAHTYAWINARRSGRDIFFSYLNSPVRTSRTVETRHGTLVEQHSMGRRSSGNLVSCSRQASLSGGCFQHAV